MSETTGHIKKTFQIDYWLEKKLLQELGDEMFTIISNTVQSKINPFIKSIWEDQHQMELVTTTVRKSTTVYHLLVIKQGLNS